MAKTALSEKPWSDYTSADYSIEQWHSSCLIHQHEGTPTSKSQCKLPVKTPNGVVNKNAVHAAAAALAGARGGVNASSNEKASAAKTLIRYYHQMDEKPPPSLLTHSNVNPFLEHYGKKGMRWGVRTGKSKTSSDYRKTSSHRGKKPSQLTNKQLQELNKRMNLEQNYRKMNPTKVKKGQALAKGIMASATAAASVYTLVNSPPGKASVKAGKNLLRKSSAGKKLISVTKKVLEKSIR